MRRALAVVVVVVGLLAPPAHAEERFTLTAPVPGTVLTAPWIGVLCIGCGADGIDRQVLRSAGWGDRPLLNPRMLAEICDRPSPPGSWDEEFLGSAPAGAAGLTARLQPVINWDMFACSHRAPTEAELRSDPDDADVRWRLDGVPALSPRYPCESPVPELPIGCPEVISTTVADGRPYKLIGYNWSDAFPAPGSWRWL